MPFRPEFTAFDTLVIASIYLKNSQEIYKITRTTQKISCNDFWIDSFIAWVILLNSSQLSIIFNILVNMCWFYFDLRQFILDFVIFYPFSVKVFNIVKMSNFYLKKKERKLKFHKSENTEGNLIIELKNNFKQL